MSTGTAIFFDGISSARQETAVALTAIGVEIRASGGDLLALWPYCDIVALSAPEGVLRLGHRNNATLARLEIRDAALIAAIDLHAGGIDRGAAIDRRTRLKVVAWSLAAITSMALVGIFGVPAIAYRLTPLVPPGVELRLGSTIDRQVRSILASRQQGLPLDCGTTAGSRAGRVAFDRLVGRLEIAAGLRQPLRATVIRRPEANAITLPGGYIYVFQGLIARADSPDELAGVIAHEMGHVVNRDGTRAVLQTAGLSFLFGMLLGDFGGGGAVVVAVRTVLQSSYSREAEAAADLYGARLVAKIGGDPQALGAILVRIAGRPGPLANILLDHPEARQRAAAIAVLERPATPAALLDRSEWLAMKQICTEK
jgi:Zn-dependent protease with chaperone function